MGFHSLEEGEGVLGRVGVVREGPGVDEPVEISFVNFYLERVGL